jgi:hypothetical protein
VGSTERGVDYMTRSHPLFRLAGNASLRVRRRQYEWFVEHIGGVAGKVVLDHGSTPDTLSPDSNCFIAWLLTDGATVYAASPEDIAHLPGIFAGLHVLAWPPRADAARPFDIVVSSSVIQHVGDRVAQADYVAEVFALGLRVLLTTPNRRHWLEFHTKLPLLHWLPKAQHRAALSTLGMSFWASEGNLNLLTRMELEGLLEEAASRQDWTMGTDWYQPRFLGQVSHLVVLATDRRHAK